MDHMRPIGKLAPAAFNLLHLCVDVVDCEVHDGSGAKLIVFRLAQVQPHASAIKEGHGLARDLEQKIETQDVSIPGDRSVDIADADVKLTKTSNHAAIIYGPPSVGNNYFP